MLTADFFSRIRKEFVLTARGIHETVLAIAERVNRKVQILKLHWQAASLRDQIERLHQQLGYDICTRLASHDMPAGEALPNPLERRLTDTAARVRLLKEELMRVDPLVRQIESEAMREDLQTLERDLFLRAATIERLRIVHGAPACGRTVRQLGLPPSVRIAAVLRGPALILNFETVVLRPGDTVILLGLRVDLKTVLPLFVERKTATA